MIRSAALPSTSMRRIRFCSFCEAPKEEVEFLITGDRAGICGECLEASLATVAEWRAEKAKAAEVTR